jgi:hypothetical protein
MRGSVEAEGLLFKWSCCFPQNHSLLCIGFCFCYACNPIAPGRITELEKCSVKDGGIKCCSWSRVQWPSFKWHKMTLYLLLPHFSACTPSIYMCVCMSAVCTHMYMPVYVYAHTHTHTQRKFAFKDCRPQLGRCNITPNMEEGSGDGHSQTQNWPCCGLGNLLPPHMAAEERETWEAGGLASNGIS